MKNFFLNHQNDFVVEIFSIYHFLFILLVFLFVCLVINNKEKFINLEKSKQKKLRYILFFILLINFILRRGSFIYYDVYNYKFHLDINFCNFTSILFMIYCITGNKKIYTICYYMTFVGPLLSILFPSVNISPLNYSFYSFIILHHLIFIFNIMFMYMENLKYNKNAFIKVIIFIFIYLIVTWIFNLFFKTTYNSPLTFISNSLNEIIPFYSLNQFEAIIVMYVVIMICLFVGKGFMKILNIIIN